MDQNRCGESGSAEWAWQRDRGADHGMTREKHDNNVVVFTQMEPKFHVRRVA